MTDNPLQRGLVRLAALLIGITCLAGLASGCVLTPGRRREVWISLAVLLGAMLIGFVPLRLLLRQGPQQIIAAWIAAMIVRMFAGLIGFAILLKRYDVEPIVAVICVCGGYFVLLMVETAGMIRLVGRAFEATAASAAESQEDR